MPDDLDDDALEARLFTSAAPAASPRPQPDWQRIHLELRRPHVTLMLLWHEYKETFPDGYAYSQFAELYRRWSRHLDVVMRQSHKAGEKLFVDFPGGQDPDLRPAQRRGGLLGRACSWPSSGLRATSTPRPPVPKSSSFGSTPTSTRSNTSGAAPAIVVCDNLRSGVTRPHRYEPDVNATYAEMAAHYNVAIIPARSYKPRDKAKAESGVLVAERWIIARLRNEHFTSLAEANTEIARLARMDQRPALQEARRLEASPSSRPSTARPCGRSRRPVMSSPPGAGPS